MQLNNFDVCERGEESHQPVWTFHYLIKCDLSEHKI